jgi:UDP-N-acetylglucosamine 4,6-dehydratase
MRVRADMKQLYSIFNGKSILVTGGTGSFGKRFIKSVLAHAAPHRVIVFSRDEFKQYEMQQVLPQEKYPAIRYFLGDVRDDVRLTMAMREVDIVVHAAALKHVPAAEYNPFECLKTNVGGAENVVRAALANGVKKVLAMSTDKAANPINLYGASKLASDKIFVSSNNLSGSIGTRFAVVRYGNVAGSRGSVMPFFKQLIEQGTDHLPITDERMTRFWITLQQGVDFVTECIGNMQGGELYVPKIPSVKITELAKVMAPKLPVKIVGIRPGEKLHEIMISEDDARQTLEFEHHYTITPTFAWWQKDHESTRGGKPIDGEFKYASNTNHVWLEGAELSRFLEAALESEK